MLITIRKLKPTGGSVSRKNTEYYNTEHHLLIPTKNKTQSPLTREPLVGRVDELEAALLRDLVFAAVIELQGRGPQELVADGRLQPLDRHLVVEVPEVGHRGARGRRRVCLYTMLDKIIRP